MDSATDRPEAPRIQLAAAALFLGALWFVLCRHLSGEWSVNEQYSYGWFVPFFAAFLFWLRWEDRPAGESRNYEVGSRKRGRDAAQGESRNYEVGFRKGGRGLAIGIAMVALLMLLPVRLFEVANPDWRLLDWTHAAAVVALTLVAVWFAGGRAWVWHFAFPICFLFVAVPWITPIEEPIVQGLMRTVAAVATETLTLFGIPAELEGNLIRVSTGLVGVNEACSGVRSLQTSLMIGLLFGELKRLSVPRRILLVVGAVAIAIIANFGRAFFLVWVAATQNVAAVERWHDLAGYTIVAVVFLGSLGLTKALNRDGKVGSRNYEVGKENEEQATRAEPTAAVQRFLLPTSYFLLCFLFLVGVEIGIEVWYRSHERGLVERKQWGARFPEGTNGFRDVRMDETTRRILRFDEGRGAIWRVGAEKTEAGSRTAPGSADAAALLYFFRWQAGKNSALLANLHRPDVCLPAAGWIQVADHGVRQYSPTPTLTLPFRHFVFAQRPSTGGASQKAGPPRFAHAFYCLSEDRVRPAEPGAQPREQLGQEPSTWTRNERVSLVVEGRRHLGQQVMEVVLLSAKEMGAEEAEEWFARLLPEVVKVGGAK